MKKPVQKLSAYFSISEKEASGFMILSSIMLLLLASPYLYRMFYQRWIAEESQLVITTMLVDEQVEPVLFPFNPNNASTENLQTLGLSASLARRVENYRGTGGKFKIKSDLKKIYGFPEDLYSKLVDYIQLPDSITHITRNPIPQKTNPIKRIDLNLADEDELRRLKGIGPVLSGRIVKYRELLGGFISIDQLQEVYGMDTAVVNLVRTYLFISKDFRPKKIHLDGIAYHPYLSKEQRTTTRLLRKKYPGIKARDLLDSCGFTLETIQKISPYLETKDNDSH